jgi:hypothetical protein
MSAECSVNIIAKLTGLGDMQEFAKRFTTTATPTRAVYQYAVQDTADTAQALVVGDVGTIELIILRCVSNDVDIDTSYSVTFSAEIEVQEGEVTIFKPTGTVYFQNDDAEETSTIEYIVIGTA